MASAPGSLGQAEPMALPRRALPYRRPGLVIGVVGALAALLLGASATLGVLPGVMMLVAVAGVLLVLHRPDIGALVLVALVPATSGFARGLLVPGLRLSEILIVGLAGLILLSADGRKSRPWGWFDWIALAYAITALGLGLSQLLVRGADLDWEVVGTLLGPFQYFLLYRAVLVALPEPAQRALALRCLLIASIPISLSAILQHFHVLGVRALIPDITGVNVDTDFGDAWGVSPEGKGGRATGLFPHWQVLGAYQFWIILIGTAAALEPRPIMRRWFLIGIVALACAGIFTTITLSVIITALLGAAALALWYGRVAWILPTVLVGGVLVAVSFGPALEKRVNDQFSDAGRSRPAWVPQTMDYRYRLWRDQYLPIVSDGKWWTGYGPDAAPNLVFNYTESMYITLLMRGGIPLLLLFIALMVALVGAALRVRGDPDAVTRAAARATLVGAALLVPMHSSSRTSPPRA